MALKNEIYAQLHCASRIMVQRKLQAINKRVYRQGMSFNTYLQNVLWNA